MLTDRDLYARVDRLIDRHYIPLMLTLVGLDLTRPDYREQLEDYNRDYGRRALIEALYILLRDRPASGYPEDAKLNQLLDRITHATHLPVLNDAQRATLDIARLAMLDAIESTKQEVKKQIRQQLVELNRQHRQHVAVKRIESVSQVAERENDLKAKLMKLIPAIMLTAQDSFERAFSSVLTDTVNDVVVDSATADSLITGVPPAKTIVFKRVVNDETLCRWCRKFYANPDGSPKLFTLEELQANGSNYGKPKSEWKPVLGKTHPRCRCQLFYRR